MEEILMIENLRLTFHGTKGRVEAVKGISLSIRPGETVALVGESGSGKTALCRSIMMLHNQHAVIEEGKIMLCGRDVTKLSEDELEQVRGRDAAMVFQDPMSSLNPVFSIGSQLMEPIMLHQKTGKKEARRRALELLDVVGIEGGDERLDQYPHHFSGGMRQRAAIAIALACQPKLLIADEPTTALDMVCRDHVMGLLKRLCQDQHRATLFVTHDLALAEEIADRIIMMKDGQFVSSSHPYAQKLLSYAKYGKDESHFHGKIKTPSASGQPLVSINGLSKAFSIGRKRVKWALKDVELTINKGEILGIVGRSGCGKSTLARCLMGLYTPTTGEIMYHEPCQKQLIFQDSASAFNPRMTIFDIIAEPLVIKKSCGSRAELREKVFTIMDQVELDRELADRHPYDVSGGQRQRAAIARALIMEPDFLIADEPITSLDVPVQAQIVHLLKKLRDQRNLTMVFIAHDLPMVEHISDRIIEIHQED